MSHVHTEMFMYASMLSLEYENSEQSFPALTFMLQWTAAAVVAC